MAGLLAAANDEINRLKTELKKKDVDFHARVEDEIEAYRKSRLNNHINELTEKDDHIRRLDDENAFLKIQLNAVSVPSLTQICENPANLDEMDIIEKLAITRLKLRDELIRTGPHKDDDCVDEVKTPCPPCPPPTAGDQAPSVDGGKTPCHKKRRTKLCTQPASIARRVKARTDRKAVDITPQLNTNEIIEIHDGGGQEHEEVKEQHGPCKLMKTCNAFGKVKKAIKDKIKEYWDNKGPRYVF